jgi:hypothetical protein
MKIAYLLALIPTLALATGKPEAPKPQPVAAPVAISGAAALAGAEANAGAISGARSDATGGAANAAGGAGGAGGTGSGIANATGGTGTGSVDVGGDVSDYEARALALGQIRAYAAPAVPGECRVHTRGWDVTVASATGGTKFEAQCVADQKCFRIVEIYVRLGREAAALKQLSVCGGLLEVPVEAAPPPKSDKAVDLSAYATKEELKRAFEKAVSK